MEEDQIKGFGELLSDEDRNRGHRVRGNGQSSGRSDYKTFQSSPSVSMMLRTTDVLEQTRRQLEESEEVAKTTLVELELQRSQFVDMRGMIGETTNVTSEAKSLLRRISEKTLRKKAILWIVIILLSSVDLIIFYLLYIR